MSDYFDDVRWKKFLKESSCGAKHNREPDLDYSGLKMSPQDMEDLAREMRKKPALFKSFMNMLKKAGAGVAKVVDDHSRLGEGSCGEPEVDGADNEGGMARSQLLQILSSAQILMQLIDDGEELDAWVQSKLTKAADYLKAAESNQEYDEFLAEEEEMIDEASICKAGKDWVDGKTIGGQKVSRGADGKFNNWSARAAQIASKYCKDPNYGRGKKKNESSVTEGEGGLKAWEKENWTHSDGTPCGGGKKDGSQSRCKPASKWKTMDDDEKAADNAKKRAGTKAGKQYVPATKKGKVTKSHTKR